MSRELFETRHIGTLGNAKEDMLKAVGVNSIDQLIEETIPQNIRLKKELELAAPLSEFEYLKHIKELGSKNQQFKNYIGLGYYGTITPSVILRNVLENPGWYTAYTPYQAEISQGRMESLLNFQTMVSDLTGMELANASLLDEGTAAAEAMFMLFNSRSRDAVKREANKFFVDEDVFPQTKDVLKTRASGVGIELVFGNVSEANFTDEFFGVFVQYPSASGVINNYKSLVDTIKALDIKLVVAADILSLAILTPPGEWGADVVVGNTQRFGVPLGFGGPHAAYFATKEEYKRSIPGRIIGVSVDRHGNRALRMALQTREQHIRRDKATSNICTAQALLANMAAMYAVYHGKDGIKSIAQDVHYKTVILINELEKLGFEVKTKNVFDTLVVKVDDVNTLHAMAEASQINFYYQGHEVWISLDETVSLKKVNDLVNLFARYSGKEEIEVTALASNQSFDTQFNRASDYLTHEVFNKYHTETEMMRYIKRLENRDLSLTHSMISLGSCTMKLNAATELMPITWPEFANIHPFAPVNQVGGYLELINQLDKDLSEVTGFAKMTFQPNSGAQGEYAGLMVIKAYHEANGDFNRNIMLIPSSAHGTNPASAAIAGMKIVVVKCDDKGNIDVEDLKAKAEKYSAELAGIMITYPSTHGVYESSVIDITTIIHNHGGQVYMDGANMNAQVGLTSPGNIGADVCHLNLHKTFAIPHGGGGPGVGPIGVAEHLVPFLPSNPVIAVGGDKAITSISAAPYGSGLILLISYAYIKMLGPVGLKKSTEHAILNANYLKAKLEPHYPVLYTGENGRVAHEMILDCREFKKTAGVEVADIAKRLIDYGFHAPTVSFPVAGTLMVEPTESESMEELDRFAEAMIKIRKEISDIEKGIFNQENNLLKNAPHTQVDVLNDKWDFPYSRKEATMPASYLKEFKYWAAVSRVDNAHGDRNLICTCPPMEEYELEEI